MNNNSSLFLRKIVFSESLYQHANGYLSSIAAFQNSDSLLLEHPITYFVGENGMGKSTLLEAIAYRLDLNVEGGSNNFQFSTAEEDVPLARYLKVVKGANYPKTKYFLRGETTHNLASEIKKLDDEPAMSPPIINSYGGKSLHQQSHGEALMSIVQHRFGSRGLYILDEPETALSPQRQFALLGILDGLVRKQCQFLIATHSPILLAHPQASIYQLNESGMFHVTYDDTAMVRFARDFMNNPARYVKQLLGGKES
jgi:predicted ATPase